MSEMTNEEITSVLDAHYSEIRRLQEAVETGHFPDHDSTQVEVAESYYPIPLVCQDMRCPATRFRISSEQTSKSVHGRVFKLYDTVTTLTNRINNLETKKAWWKR